MSFRTRLISALVVMALFAGLIGVSILGTGDAGSSSESLFSRRTTLNFWYEDAALTDYLNDAAVAWNESQSEYRIEPKRVDDTDYIRTINDTSVAGSDFPDLYITGNNNLERMYKGGLAAIIHDDEHFKANKAYPQAAIDAVTYQDNIVAYPFSFETSAFLYNKDLLRSMTESLAADDSDTMEEEGETQGTNAPSGEQADLSTLVPGTMVDIINLSNKYDAPEGLSAIFKWDVSDIFYNYCFVGNYMNVGGPAGDDPDQLDIYNDKVIQCLQVYQQLNQYFSIDTRSDDYNAVIQDFIDGKIIFTIATSDAVEKIRDAVAKGESTLDYGVANIPDSTHELLNKTMSVTDCVVVNAYGEHQAAANDFVQYMLYHRTSDFYDRTGKALAQAGYVYSDPHMNGFYEAYVDSIPIMKLREASNFWMLLENTFATVWDGADANTALRSLTQQVMVQISGTENYQVPELPDPKEISIRSELEEED